MILDKKIYRNYDVHVFSEVENRNGVYEMSIEVSVVMISYNKYPQNLFTLNSFKNQTFDLSKVEIILVDDASTDDTTELQKMKFPFRFKYIRCEKNVGRSCAKNIGINHVLGNIIIFLDVEMLIEPNFIENHYIYQKDHENVVVSTTNLQKRVYTVLEQEFNSTQIRECYSMLNSNNAKRSLKLNSKIIKNSKDSKKFKKFVRGLQKSYPLLSDAQLDGHIYQKFSFPDPTFEPIINKYGPYLTNFHIPWIFCITRNISLPKKLLDQVGYFSEEFEGWGSEDNELGYRLYKLGAKFIDAPNIITYHQEHSYSTSVRYHEMIRNIIKFQQMHSEIDVAVISLPFINKGSFIIASEVLDDYQKLSIDSPNEYELFKNTLLKALHEALKLCLEEKSLDTLPKRCISNSIEIQKKLLFEATSIRSSKKYPSLITVFDELLKIDAR